MTSQSQMFHALELPETLVFSIDLVQLPKSHYSIHNHHLSGQSRDILNPYRTNQKPDFADGQEYSVQRIVR